MVDVVNMAHFKIPRRLKKSKFRPPSLSSVTCPICLSILIEPVTMPCKHELCMSCFQQTLSESSLRCPLCRVRVSSWARKAAKEKTLINHKRWHEIQVSFPEKVDSRLRGLDDELEEASGCVVERSLSAPGEIKKEFEEQLKMWQEKQKKFEQESFLMLLKRLQYEKQAEHQQQPPPQFHLQPQDFAHFSDDPKQFVTTSHEEICTQINGCDDPEIRTIESRGSCSSNISRSESADSNDSITQELCHFKPIKIAPKTPPKQLPDGRIEEPLLVIATPRNLRRLSHLDETSVSFSACLPLSHKLSLIEADRSSRIAGKISQSTETELSMFAKTNVPSSDVLKEHGKPILPLEPNLPLADQTSMYHPSSAFSDMNFSSSGYLDNDSVLNLNGRKTKSSSSTKSSIKSDRSRPPSGSFQEISIKTKKFKLDPVTITEPAREGVASLSSSKTPTILDTKEIVAEQELIMERLKQEEVDRQIAYKLQQKFDLETQTLHRMGVREPYQLRKRIASTYHAVQKQ